MEHGRDTSSQLGCVPGGLSRPRFSLYQAALPLVPENTLRDSVTGPDLPCGPAVLPLAKQKWKRVHTQDVHEFVALTIHNSPKGGKDPNAHQLDKKM